MRKLVLTMNNNIILQNLHNAFFKKLSIFFVDLVNIFSKQDIS